MIAMLISFRFALSKKWLWTNGRTDGPMDGQMDQRTDQQTEKWMDKASYRDAWTHLEIWEKI